MKRRAIYNAAFTAVGLLLANSAFAQLDLNNANIVNLGGNTYRTTQSSSSPYVVPTAAGVKTLSLLTVTNSATNGYKLVGAPDGMGSYLNGDGTFTLLVNHELGSTEGAVRAHGATGAFVSKWTFNSTSAAAVAGSDLFTSVVTTGSTSLGRFCSGNLAPQTAFQFGSLGTSERIYFNGEEVGSEGRAIGTVVSTGTAFDLPRLGKASWENYVANPFAQTKTIMVGTDDSSPGQVYVYIGNKTNTGTAVDRAGLTNGNLFGVKAPLANEVSATGLDGSAAKGSVAFTLHNFGDVSSTTGAALNTSSNTASVTNFLRPEDGAWDNAHATDFYFATTNAFGSPSRLWRMRFSDIANPENGGTLTELLDGTEGQQMLDNLCVVNGQDGVTRVLMQEDVGGNSRLGKIWLFDTSTNSMTEVAAHSASFFQTGGANFLTQDEESSGIIDASDTLGPGWFILTSQAHYTISGEFVQGGQLLAMYVPQAIPEPGSIGLLATGAIGLLARRKRRIA